VTEATVVLAAFASGIAVGAVGNALSNWTLRLGRGRPDGEAGRSATWPSIFALQFVLRIFASFASLYATYRLTAGDTGALMANLGGLLVARYLLLWRLARGGSGETR